MYFETYNVTEKVGTLNADLDMLHPNVKFSGSKEEDRRLSEPGVAYPVVLRDHSDPLSSININVLIKEMKQPPRLYNHHLNRITLLSVK